MFHMLRKKTTLPDRAQALPGRSRPIVRPGRHHVNGRELDGPFPTGSQHAMFGMGCFWGVERLFWQQAGIWVTSAGYAAGSTPNPTYEEVCTGMTGHNEVVRATFDPETITYRQLLKLFWENHDPTQGMRQGNDIGTQYRSGIYVFDQEQKRQAEASLEECRELLAQVGRGNISTEICPAPTYYFAEGYHQQYLAKNPWGYCNLAGCGIEMADDPGDRSRQATSNPGHATT